MGNRLLERFGLIVGPSAQRQLRNIVQLQVQAVAHPTLFSIHTDLVRPLRVLASPRACNWQSPNTMLSLPALPVQQGVVELYSPSLWLQPLRDVRANTSVSNRAASVQLGPEKRADSSGSMNR